MSSSPSPANVNRRRHQRMTLPPMYSCVTARCLDGSGQDLRGHAYDISQGGVRIELDEPMPVGQTLAIDMELPGEDESISAAGDVVWVNDAQDDPGPRRMAVRFRRFDTTADRIRLLDYLGEDTRRAAA